MAMDVTADNRSIEHVRANHRVFQAESGRRLNQITYWYSMATLAVYCLRDALTAAARYYLDMLGLSALWFFPDLMAFGSLGLFILVYCIRDRNLIARFFALSFAFSMFMSAVFFDGDMIAVFSSAKMFLPIFPGLCFVGRSVTEKKLALRLLVLVFLLSAVGLIANPYIQYPWFGYSSTNSFGLEREASKLWWAGGEVRYGGLAGDSTMAGFMVIFTFIMISRFYGVVTNIIGWPIVYLALKTSTSKTALGVFGVYVLVYIVLVIIRPAAQLRVLRRLSKWSFLCILAPPLIIIFFGGIDISKISPLLFSLGDRINRTWGGPYLIIADIFPVGLFTGCGLGCFSYPMFYSKWADYFLPLDNFYLTTILMMGYPFIIFILLLFRGVNRMENQVKLSLLLVWNVYTVTVQAYGPSYATVVFGYAISDLFRRTQKSEGGVLRRVAVKPVSEASHVIMGR